MWGEFEEEDEGGLDVKEEPEEETDSAKELRDETGVLCFRSSDADDGLAKEENTSAYLTGDGILLNVIQLLQYRRLLRSVQAAEQQRSGRRWIPELPEAIRHQPCATSAVSNLSDELIHDLLRKSMASLIAFSGFDDIDDEALETLTDVAAGSLGRLTELLKLLQSRQASGAESPFLEPLNHALKLVGIASPSVLLDDYDVRVRDYHKRLLQECKQLKRQFETSKTDEQPSDTTAVAAAAAEPACS